ncbi:hypothetical protein CE11_01141 [Megavirus courdo11]|uniref:F-box domain-containing protein n=1 Tax=Megavirus courdo11 TaxID=1128140 RepID=K7YGG8_9VIRU|nr:hypothetical protein CE11_01141 [Megavirus courdo11]
MSNIDILNDDVILCVFSYLSKKDKIMFCSVNKYYREIIHYIPITNHNHIRIKYLSGQIQFKNLWNYILFRHAKNSFKNELKYIRDSIIFSPQNLRSKFLHMRWNLSNGLPCNVETNSRKLFEYFGINSMEKVQSLMFDDNIIFD